MKSDLIVFRYIETSGVIKYRGWYRFLVNSNLHPVRIALSLLFVVVFDLMHVNSENLYN